MWSNRIRKNRTPRCPYCGVPVDADSVRPRDLQAFPCPACHGALKADVPHPKIHIAASVALSGVTAWAIGLRGFDFAVALIPLYFLFQFLGGAVVGPFTCPEVKPYGGSKRRPRPHYLSLGISRRSASDGPPVKPSGEEAPEEKEFRGR